MHMLECTRFSLGLFFSVKLVTKENDTESLQKKKKQEKEYQEKMRKARSGFTLLSIIFTVEVTNVG